MPEKFIMPTIGRRIWYWPIGTETVNTRDYRQPFDAGVIYVTPEGRVSLYVTDHEGQRFVRPGVEITDGVEPGCAQGMPYQVGQARKA